MRHRTKYKPYTSIPRRQNKSPASNHTELSIVPAITILCVGHNNLPCRGSSEKQPSQSKIYLRIGWEREAVVRADACAELCCTEL